MPNPPAVAFVDHGTLRHRALSCSPDKAPQEGGLRGNVGGPCFGGQVLERDLCVADQSYSEPLQLLLWTPTIECCHILKVNGPRIKRSFPIVRPWDHQRAFGHNGSCRLRQCERGARTVHQPVAVWCR